MIFFYKKYRSTPVLSNLLIFFYKKYRSTLVQKTKQQTKDSVIDDLLNELLKFFYQVIKNKKKMHIYCKKCSKHTANTFPKKLGKLRCAICLTERTFIDEVKYDLESALEIYLQFFTD